MCNVGDDVEEEKAKFMQARTTVNLKNSVCVKCRTAKPQVVLQNQYPYCKDCFLSATVHKFKALLGKNRIAHPNEKVLIYHKTGHASTALLHFLRTGLDLTTPKKIRFEPILLFVEGDFKLSVQQRRLILQQVSEEAQRFGFRINYVCLTQYILDSTQLSSLICDKFDDVLIKENDAASIAGIMKKPNVTTQTEIIKLYEQRLLVDVAKFLNCKCIFTPDLGIDIASQLLTNVCLGRGEHIVFDTGTVDSRDSEVTILKPLRNFTIKEIALYNFFNGLEPVRFLAENVNPYKSIQNLMQKFVSDLQENYPATISTIVRTGDKLGVNKNVGEAKCLLCKAPLGTKPDTLSSSEATNFSHWVSTQTPNCGVSVRDRSKHILEAFNNADYGKYCFSCNQIQPFLCLREV
ncbi:hypothetical protein RN001_011586 [Aquatica leii]|uniref:Cytoplasmic tRNA 2-thiolation protein 2 n=1 Tax=Aquatica leii TaxID=1421715 RepID=A0AAN7PRY5_9COLE|nr:hypothetical protein RN001_011586 [Aquatica leii]